MVTTTMVRGGPVTHGSLDRQAKRAEGESVRNEADPRTIFRKPDCNEEEAEGYQSAVEVQGYEDEWSEKWADIQAELTKIREECSELRRELSELRSKRTYKCDQIDKEPHFSVASRTNLPNHHTGSLP